MKFVEDANKFRLQKSNAYGKWRVVHLNAFECYRWIAASVRNKRPLQEINGGVVAASKAYIGELAYVLGEAGAMRDVTQWE